MESLALFLLVAFAALFLAGIVSKLSAEVMHLRIELEALKAVAVTHPDIKSAFAEAADKAAEAVLKRPGCVVPYVQKAKGMVS